MNEKVYVFLMMNVLPDRTSVRRYFSWHLRSVNDGGSGSVDIHVGAIAWTVAAKMRKNMVTCRFELE